MENILLDLVQNKIEAAVRLNLLTKNIKPTQALIEHEVDKRMIKLADKLCELAWSD